MMTVDWSRPIEAVHEDGRVFPVELAAGEEQPHHSLGTYLIADAPGRATPHGWRSDGTAYNGKDYGWRIRNTEQFAENAKSPLPPELQERMVALVRRIDTLTPREVGDTFVGKAQAQDERELIREVRAIVADPGFPAEVDADLVEARTVMLEHGWHTAEHIEPLVLAALRRGKQMAGEA